VWKNTVKNKGAVAAFTPVSHTLYLNDCKPNGCIVKPGNDNSKTNTSSIPSNQRTLAAFPYPYWDELVACVKDTFAPFDINIVTTDPGNANHFEVMVGGTATALSPDLQGAGGVAPFIDCSTTTDNVISFVFAQEVNDLEFLCGAVAQEAAHVWGLDHELNADDPMTYLDLGTSKRFQDVAARCGEELTNANGAGPRDCFCGDPTQNSFQFLSNTFDNSNIGPASAAITSPTNGQYVRPGFPIRATLDSPLQFRSGQLKADGAVVGEINESLAIALPASVPAGDRMLTVSLTDTGSRTASASVMVHVIGSCAAGCAAGTACINDLCVPNGVDGGLGDTCTTNEECLTGTCASDGTLSACTGSCDNGACPSGFECLSSNICWPESSSGGCATGGNSAGFLLIGLGFAVVLLRRRHRN
jgi:MYXO-CTERM domain-containing protein